MPAKLNSDFETHNRQAMFDHVRIVLTALVIFHHAASVYGGSGEWYWREEASSSNQILVGFNAINQSFFMGFFFLISGYFSAASLSRKSVREFVADRCLRLGLPLLTYFFVISPFTIALAAAPNPESFWSVFKAVFFANQFEPGPLWFVQSLLIFSACYIAWQKLTVGRFAWLSALPGVGILAISVLALGVLSFVIRLYIPVGQSVLWLQLGYFPCYVFLFTVGCASYKLRILEKITLRQALVPMLLSAIALASLPWAMSGGLGSGSFGGGFNANAFYYALWDPVLAFGILLGVLWSFSAWWSRGSGSCGFLARRSYAIYVLHPPVLVAFSIALSQWVADPLAKTVVAGLASYGGCILIASFLLWIPPVRRVL